MKLCGIGGYAVSASVLGAVYAERVDRLATHVSTLAARRTAFTCAPELKIPMYSLLPNESIMINLSEDRKAVLCNSFGLVNHDFGRVKTSCPRGWAWTTSQAFSSLLKCNDSSISTGLFIRFTDDICIGGKTSYFPVT